MLNLRTIMGLVKENPEVKSTPFGLVARFKVGILHRWHDRESNQSVEHTIWEVVEAYDQAAERVRDSIERGCLVFVEGDYFICRCDDPDCAQQHKSLIKTYRPHEVFVVKPSKERQTANVDYEI